MKVLSVNVGKPKAYNYKGKTGFTSIFKTPVDGELSVAGYNIEGDEQGDLTVHGGDQKAIYSYDVAYYEYWKQRLEWSDWNYGLFGENLTTSSLTDDQVLVGNIYQVGSVILKAIQPRFPCFKLNIRFGNDDMLSKFMQSGRNGTYFSILQEGRLQSGESIQLLEKSPHNVSIQQLVESYYNKGQNTNLVQQILAIDFLPSRLSTAFESYLSR